MTFRTGDWIVSKDRLANELTAGRKYYVHNATSTGAYVYVTNDKGKMCHYFKTRFTPAKEDEKWYVTNTGVVVREIQVPETNTTIYVTKMGASWSRDQLTPIEDNKNGWDWKPAPPEEPALWAVALTGDTHASVLYGTLDEIVKSFPPSKYTISKIN